MTLDFKKIKIFVENSNNLSAIKKNIAGKKGQKNKSCSVIG